MWLRIGLTCCLFNHLYWCRIAELCDGNGCVLFNDYLVGVLLTDLARVYAFKRGEENMIARASTPL